MPGWLVSAFKAAVGATAAAVIMTGIIAPSAAPMPSAAATPTTAVRHTSTSVTGTTRPVHSTTTPPPTTLPPATIPLPPAPLPTTRRFPIRTLPATTAPTTTTSSTTIAPIGGHLSVPPSTLPLRTKTQSAHVSPVFAALSGAGFFVALVIMATRFVLTRPRRKT
ncbi:MAG TPA: hypothetical protein VGL49_04915 [Acidimicrobiales bacterium]